MFRVNEITLTTTPTKTNTQRYSFNRIHTPSSDRATPIDMFEIPDETEQLHQQQQQKQQPDESSQQLQQQQQEKEGHEQQPPYTSRKLSQMESTRESQFLCSPKYIQSARKSSELSPLTILENRKSSVLLNSLQNMSPRPTSSSYSHVKRSQKPIRTFAKVEDNVRFAENPSKNSELVVKECIAVTKQVSRLLKGRHRPEDDEDDSDSQYRRNVTQRTVPPAKGFTGKYSKALPKDLQKKLLLRMSEIQKDPNYAAQMMNNQQQMSATKNPLRRYHSLQVLS